MQPGDLRRFTVNDSGGGDWLGECWSAGDIFMVIDIVEVPGRADRTGVTFLVGGRLVTQDWGLPWIMNNSEVINEAG